MNLKNAFYFVFSLLLMAGITIAQQAAPPAAPPMPDEPGEARERRRRWRRLSRLV